MGYDCVFRISVDKHERFVGKELKKASKLYHKLTKRPWFPRVDETQHTGSGGYGCGDNEDRLEKEFSRFTSKFPKYTFKLWMVYFDYEELCVIEMKGKELISVVERSAEKIEIISDCSMYVTFEHIEVENEISFYEDKRAKKEISFPSSDIEEVEE